MGWMFRTLLDDISFLSGLSDSGIAMLAALEPTKTEKKADGSKKDLS